MQLSERLRRQTSVAIELQYLITVDLLPIQEYVLYSLVREGITNTLKHSQASQIRIAFTETAQESIPLTIIDNGNDTSCFKPRFGLTHLRHKL